MTFGQGCAVFLGALALMVIVLIVSGFIASVAWNLFMPQIFGLSEIGWVQGIALSYLLSLAGGSSARVHDSASKTFTR